MPLQPESRLSASTACSHGGIDYAEMEKLGIRPENVLDFSVSTNPFMPPPGIRDIMKNAPVERYPDSLSTTLRRRLAEKIGIMPENILVGSGTTELIRLIASTCFRRGDRVLIPEPTYGEYEVACRIAGARPLKYRSKEEDSFRPDIAQIIGIIKKNGPKGIFICNPNNPTGHYLSQGEIKDILDVMVNSLVILDEAYVAFVEKTWNSLNFISRDNVIILRSMTKDYGLPGLRLGYAAASVDIVRELQSTLPPWNVNCVAQEVGKAVLDCDDYLKQSLIKVHEVAEYLTGEFSRLGFTVLPSDAHYFLVKVGSASEFRRLLLKQGIQVRDCSSFGLENYIRISPRPMPDCKKLIAAVEKLVN